MASATEYPDSKYFHEYNMNHSHRGIGLIFNHESFYDPSHPSLAPRKGSGEDTNALMATLDKLGFAVRPYKDITKRQISNILLKVSEEDHTEHDCIVIAVMSHGGAQDIIHAFDDSYKRDALWENFSADNCPTLAGKPKILIIQACRGVKRDAGTSMDHEIDAGKSDLSPEYKEEALSFKIPNMCDFIMFNSCFPGYVSFRQKGSKGSSFIKTLCEVLNENYEEAPGNDLLSMATVVNCRVALTFNINIKTDSTMTDMKQCSFVESSLLRKIYFRPKINTIPHDGKATGAVGYYSGQVVNIHEDPVDSSSDEPTALSITPGVSSMEINN